jgi:hypothetical protein
MEQTPELRAAIEGLYAAFAEYPLRDNTNACSCCHTDQDEQRLHTKSLHSLSVEDLRKYADDALLVWGDETDFKHFLPRIFELEVACGDGLVDPQVALSKLAHAQWRDWPQPEQRSVELFLRLLWDCVINVEPHDLAGMEIDDWLCGIAQAESGLSVYLANWLSAEGKNPRLNLAAFIADTDFANPNSHADGYWGPRAELFEEVGAWVRSDAVKTRMAEIASEYPQHGFVERAYVSLP